MQRLTVVIWNLTWLNYTVPVRNWFAAWPQCHTLIFNSKHYIGVYTDTIKLCKLCCCLLWCFKLPHEGQIKNLNYTQQPCKIMFLNTARETPQILQVLKEIQKKGCTQPFVATGATAKFDKSSQATSLESLVVGYEHLRFEHEKKQKLWILKDVDSPCSSTLLKATRFRLLAATKKPPLDLWQSSLRWTGQQKR